MARYRNPGVIEFDGVITRADVAGSSSFVTFPYEVRELFGVAGRVPITALIDGLDYRGSLVTYGGPHLLLILTAIREKLGKQPGDSVHVRLELDEAERVVELDQDVADSLVDAGLMEAFRGMSYSHQREYALWIADAKKPETRRRRIEKMTAMVAEGLRLK